MVFLYRDLGANDNLPSTSTNQEPESSKSSQPSLPKILPKIDLPGGAMLYHSSVLTGLDGLGSNLGLGNLAMGYPHSFILGLANQGQEGGTFNIFFIYLLTKVHFLIHFFFNFTVV